MWYKQEKANPNLSEGEKKSEAYDILYQYITWKHPERNADLATLRLVDKLFKNETLDLYFRNETRDMYTMIKAAENDIVALNNIIRRKIVGQRIRRVDLLQEVLMHLPSLRTMDTPEKIRSERRMIKQTI